MQQRKNDFRETSKTQPLELLPPKKAPIPQRSFIRFILSANYSLPVFVVTIGATFLFIRDSAFGFRPDVFSDKLAPTVPNLSLAFSILFPALIIFPMCFAYLIAQFNDKEEYMMQSKSA